MDEIEFLEFIKHRLEECGLDRTYGKMIINNRIESLKKPTVEEQLKMEIRHIFDSGANEERIFNMTLDFIKTRYDLKIPNN